MPNGNAALRRWCAAAGGRRRGARLAAEEYLSDRHVSIAEIAFLLGFSDQSSFNRALRRWTGMPPGRWRKQRARMRGATSSPDAVS